MELARVKIDLHGHNLGQAVQKTVEAVMDGLTYCNAISPRVTIDAEPTFDPKVAYLVFNPRPKEDAAQS